MTASIDLSNVVPFGLAQPHNYKLVVAKSDFLPGIDEFLWRLGNSIMRHPPRAPVHSDSILRLLRAADNQLGRSVPRYMVSNLRHP